MGPMVQRDGEAPERALALLPRRTGNAFLPEQEINLINCLFFSGQNDGGYFCSKATPLPSGRLTSNFQQEATSPSCSTIHDRIKAIYSPYCGDGYGFVVGHVLWLKRGASLHLQATVTILIVATVSSLARY